MDNLDYIYDDDRVYIDIDRPNMRGRHPRRRIPDLHPPFEWHDPSFTQRKLDRGWAGTWVYFIGWAGGPVKIGKAIKPKARLQELQVGCPYPLYLWAISSKHDEATLHGRFCLSQLMGEWFRLTPELERLMRGLNSIAKKGSRNVAADNGCGRNRDNTVDNSPTA